MKISASVLAVLTLTSQLALAETPAETDTQSGDPAVTTADDANIAEASTAATDSQIKSLESDLRPSLQSKLDSQMHFELESRGRPLRAIASVN